MITRSYESPYNDIEPLTLCHKCASAINRHGVNLTPDAKIESFHNECESCCDDMIDESDYCLGSECECQN